MFIRVNKTRNKKTNTVYETHRLIESYRTEKGPRQRVLINLGKLTIPKSDWKKLAFLLESKLAGQTTTFDGTKLGTLAASILENHNLHTKKIDSKEIREKEKELVTVDLGSIATEKSRSLGPEIVANHFFEKLGFDKILRDLMLSERQIALAKGTIIGRLIEPGSEANTLKWLKQRTSLLEMLDDDISLVGKNALYDISDILLSQKDYIEKALRSAEKRLFPDEKTLFLYDLTNTHFEGSCKKNTLAFRGKSKKKRSDAPLVTLALLVDSRGFPIFSQIYKGNQSEPQTLENVLDTLLDQETTNFTETRSTIVMDRGIATIDNLKLLKEKNYPYIIIERRDITKNYIKEFKASKESFDTIKDSKDQNIYLKKIEITEGTRVLCVSEMRKEKELAIDNLKESRFREDVEKLAKSIEKGLIKLKEKVFVRIGRIKQKYSSIAKYYDIKSTLNEKKTKVEKIFIEKKETRDERTDLTGCYVIETSHEDLTAEEIWRLYTTLTRVESSFKALKTDLGMRPIHHQIAKRTEGHLFISLLAYHLLNSIEVTLADAGYRRKWSTVKDDLSTHQRTTVVMMDENNDIHHIRVSGQAESSHSEIYKILGAKDPLKKKHRKMSSSL